MLAKKLTSVCGSVCVFVCVGWQDVGQEADQDLCTCAQA